MKITVIALALCLTILSLAGCGHEHAEADMWSLDAEQHWHECAGCDEKLDAGAHTFDGLDVDGLEICSVCRSGMYEGDDGCRNSYSYDEYDNLVFAVYYDAEGEMTFRDRYEYEYYPDGSIKYEKNYYCDMTDNSGEERLLAEYEYHPGADGGTYMSKDVCYYDNGAYCVTMFDEVLGVIEMIDYAADGSVIERCVYEYEVNEDGDVLAETLYVNDVISSEIIYDIDDEGYYYESVWIEYDENGEPIAEYHYDSEGNEID